MTEVSEERRELPPWLIGLILAGIVFAVLLLVINALGFGDDPALETPAPATPEALPTTQGGPSETDGLVFTFWDGYEGSFEDFRGQPLVLNFWPPGARLAWSRCPASSRSIRSLAIRSSSSGPTWLTRVGPMPRRW